MNIICPFRTYRWLWIWYNKFEFAFYDVTVQQVCQYAARPSIFSDLYLRLFINLQSAPLTMGTFVFLTVHKISSFLTSFRYFPDFLLHWIHGKLLEKITFVMIFLSIVIISCFLTWIEWFIWFSKSERILCIFWIAYGRCWLVSLNTSRSHFPLNSIFVLFKYNYFHSFNIWLIVRSLIST